jgi:hypothetical protein
MKPRDMDLESILRGWIDKAEADLEPAERPRARRRRQYPPAWDCRLPLPTGGREVPDSASDVVSGRIPKTHEPDRLRALVKTADREAAEALREVRWPGPLIGGLFGKGYDCR